MEDLVTVLGPSATAIGLHVPRLLPVAILCPFLGGPLVPATVRLVLAVGLATTAWCAGGSTPADRPGLELLAIAASELGLGVAFGLAASLPFEAARAGGRLIDTVRGSTLHELHVAPLRQRESATGDLLAQWIVVLAASVGGDRLVLSALTNSFEVLPVGGISGIAQTQLGVGLRASSEVLACALALGAPAAAGVLAADLAIGVAGRAVPGLALACVTQPARAALGLLALALPTSALAGRLVSVVALSVGLLRSGGTAP